MSLLDEAIREHLDLKRRRGADPAEIERAEREALGPVRRDPFEHAPDDFGPISVADDRVRAYDHEEDLYDHEGYEEYGAREEWDEELEDEPHFAPPGMDEAEQGEVTGSATLMEREYVEDPQPPFAAEPAGPRSYPPAPGVSDETVQYEVEEALSSERAEAERAPEWVEPSEEGVEPSEEWVEPSHQPVETSAAEQGAERPARGEEDVLEETREFIQDTPDHDRLWFEQRRRRDFDFDG